MSKSTLTPLNPGTPFQTWLRNQKPYRKHVYAIVIHHTWRPRARDYAGVSTIASIRDYHMSARGWSDIGANAYACPDGKIVTARPLDRSNWAHTLVSLPWSRVDAQAKDICQGDKLWFNHYAFGIETVGDFTSESIADGTKALISLRTSIAAAADVCKVFDIPINNIFFHRDVADKDCPGQQLTRVGFRDAVKRVMDGDMPGLGLEIVRDGNIIECNVRTVEGQAVANVRPLLEGLGYVVAYRVLSNGAERIYVKDQEESNGTN